MWALNNSASASPKVSELLDVVQGYLWSTRDRVESELLGSILVRFALIGYIFSLLVDWVWLSLVSFALVRVCWVV